MKIGPFMQRPDLLALFNVSGLKEDPRYPAIWQWYDGGGFRTGPDDLLGVEDWTAMAWFVPTCRDLANQKLEADLVSTSVDEVIVAMGRYSADLEADAFGHPIANRPTWQLANAFVLPYHLAGMRKKAEGNNRPDWLSDAFGLRFVRARIQNTPRDTEAAVSWWFNPDSYGWLSQSEYDNSLKSIDGLISDKTRASLLDHWQFWGGKEQDFNPLWEEFAREMTIIRADLEARKPGSNFKPFSYGEDHYRVMFDRLGIPENFQQFREEAARRWELLNTEANRLAAMLGYTSWHNFIENYDFSDSTGPQLLADDNALVTAYTAACAESERLFRQAGALNVQWANHHTMSVDLVGPSQTHSTPTAMVMCADRSDDPNSPVHSMMQGLTQNSTHCSRSFVSLILVYSTNVYKDQTYKFEFLQTQSTHQ